MLRTTIFSAVVYRCALAAIAALLLAGSDVAEAAISIVDNPLAAPAENTSGAVSQSFTVSAGANVLVVAISNCSGTPPATVTWDGFTLIKAVDNATTGSPALQRDAALYYLYNPLSQGSLNNLTTTANIAANTTKAYTVNAFTLSGVDTSVAPLTGINVFSTASTNPVTAAINVATAGSWGVSEEISNLDTTAAGGGSNVTGFSFTSPGATSQPLSFGNHGGSTVATVDLATGVSAVEGLSVGSDTITGTINPTGGANYIKSTMAAMVFAPINAWIGGASGAATDWGTAANWNPALVPDGLTVTFGLAGATGTVDLGASGRTVGGLSFRSNVSTAIGSTSSQTLTLDNGAIPATVIASGTHSISAAVGLNSDLALTINASSQLTMSGGINNGTDGSPNLTVTGPGTLVLSANSGFSGMTTDTGSLRVTNGSGSATGSGPVAVNSGGILGGNGIISGDVTLSAVGTGHLAPHTTPTGFSTLHLGNLTFNGGSVLDFNFGTPGVVGSPGTSDQVLATGSVNLNGTTTVNIANQANFAGGIYKLIGYGSLSGFSFSSFGVGTSPAGFSFQFNNNTGSKEIDLIALTPGPVRTWAGGTGDWDTTTPNWVGSTTYSEINLTTFTASDAVVFSNGATTGNVNVTATFTPASVTLNSTDRDYTFSGSGSIGGVGALTINTAGHAVSLNTANSYSGGTNLTAGTLNINNASAIGVGTLTIGGGTIDNTSSGDVTLSTNNLQNWNGDFTYAGSLHSLNLGTGAVALGSSRTVTVSANALTVGGTISGGAVNFSKAGAGTLVLGSVSNNYSGNTTISGGVLSVNTLANGGSPSSIGTSSNAATSLVLDGGTLRYTGGAVSIDRQFTVTQNGGGLDSSGSDAITFTSMAAVTTTGSGPRTLTLTGSNTNVNTLNTIIADGTGGATSLVKSGAGTWLLKSNSTFTGSTNVTQGMLQAGGNALGPTGAVTVAANATLQVTAPALGNIAVHWTGYYNLETTDVTGTAGVVPNSHWTNIEAGYYVNPPSNNYTNLVDSTGAATTAAVTSAVPNTGTYYQYYFGATPTNNVIKGPGGGQGGGTGSFIVANAITGIPYANYNIIAYINGANTGNSQVWLTSAPNNVYYYSPTAGTTDNYVQVTNTNSASFPSGNYVVFSGLTGSSQTMEFLGPGGDGFNGFEVVNTSAGPLTMGSLTGAGTLDLNGNGATVGANNADSLFSGNIINSGAFTKVGTGALTLTGSNANTGATSINAGTIVANANLGTGPLTLGTNGTGATGGTLRFAGVFDPTVTNSSVTLNAGGGTFDTQALTITIAGALGGTGGLTKAGSGTLILTNGANNYGGATVVSAGTLRVTNSFGGSATGMGPVSVAVGAALGGSGGSSGSIAGLVTVAGHLAPNGFIGTASPGTVTNLTLNGGLNLSNGAFLDYILGSVASHDLVTIGNSAPLTLGTGVTLDVTQAPGYGLGTYELISYGSGAVVTGDANLSSWTVAGGGSGKLFSFSDNTVNHEIDLAITQASTSSSWNFAGSGNYSDLSKWTNQLFPSNAGQTATFGAGSSVTINSGTVGSNSLVVTNDVSPTLGTLIFDNTTVGYTLSGGTITMNNNNAGSAGAFVQVNNGSHIIASALVLADSGGTTFNVAGSANNLTISGTISGNTLTKSGVGTLTLNNTNSYSSGTIVSAGTLATTAAGSLGTGGLAVNSTAGATVVNIGSNENTLTGGLTSTVSNGGTAAINIASGDSLTVGPASGSATYGGTLTLGPGATFAKSGAGVEILTTAPQLAGINSQLNVSGGTLRLAVSSGSPGVNVGSGVTANLSISGKLELAGTVSVLGTAGGNRVQINGSSPTTTLLVSAGDQHVGGIDGVGTVQANTGTSLTADHITAGALVIGGTATTGATVSIDASDLNGNPQTQAGGFSLAGSLASNDPFASGMSSSASLLAATEPSSAVGSSFGNLVLGNGGGASAVPEPSSMLLLVLGGLACLLPALRRRK